MRRRVTIADGEAAVATILDALHQCAESTVPRPVLATAVRYLLEELGTRHPGYTLEVRVPPFGAVQCVAGPKHSRGTPPNVVETDPITWVRIATGLEEWGDVLRQHRVTASGTRASLEGLVPLIQTRPPH